ncbi:MAG TPA: CCA tRNA nucleotidyltransferase [Granulicella sp.]|nr:CCA tRNA nucleotidyltransferase [Granulicella sp.]
MADYIYLLENRLSPAQKQALTLIRQIAREKALTVFLVGGAVRDLTSGSPVRDLDVVVQGNALKIKKDIEKVGGVIEGEQVAGQALFVRFAGGVRVEVGSTLSVTYPKPGKPVFGAATILEDLRRRDFTANAMALSLNEGSYGLLMDPLNGVADIENRELRLVSNYGFIEDPIRMVRAVRLMARLGWQMDEKTQGRYETGKQEEYIRAASEFQLGYEAEEIVHEEDALRVLRRLENEGWMKFLAPAWTTAKVNAAELEKMRETQTQLQMQGIHPDPSAGNFPLLTAKMSAKEVAELKKSFPRQGFVAEIESLEGEAKEFAAQLAGKTAALPSQAWKLLYAARPEAVLAVAYSTKSATLQAKFKSFFTEWPSARQRVPYALLQEMRITPELPGYAGLIESLAFALMDGRLGTVEEMRAFLEPHSPPAPPPTVHVRRPRTPRKDAKAKGRGKKAAGDAETTEEGEEIAAEVAEETEEAEPVIVPVKATAAPGKAPAAAVVKAAAPVEPAAKAVAPVKTAAAAGKASAAPAKSKVVTAPAPKAGAAVAAKKAASVPAPAKGAKATAKPTVAKQVAKTAAPAKKTAPPAKAVAAKKAVAKKAAAKTVPAKKAVAKKAAPVKVAVKKAVAKKAPAPAVKKAVTKTAMTKKTPAKKAVAKKAASVKKASAKKAVAGKRR